MDPLDLQANFLKALEQAEAVQAVDVPARVVLQAGREVLVAACPKCGHLAALSGEGKHLCRHCATWLRFVRR